MQRGSWKKEGDWDRGDRYTHGRSPVQLGGRNPSLSMYSECVMLVIGTEYVVIMSDSLRAASTASLGLAGSLSCLGGRGTASAAS